MFNALPDNFLTKVDRASMAYALEARSPFLDYRFIEFSQCIPTEWKVDFFRSKKLLKQMIKDVIPDEIVHRGKKGFTPPLKQWITDQKYDPFLKQASEYLKELNPDLFKLLKERVFVKRNKPYDFYRIRLFIFGKWFEKWIDKPIGQQTPGIT
jgi:asparagine synthase (glutamine-hydrolysing)